MLSYRHGFHAGNHADVLKHLTLVLTLDYLTRKPGPLLYLDTHAGAGRYPIGDEMMQKTGEFAAGVGALQIEHWPAEGQLYLDVLARSHAEGFYPGSPLIAARMLREQDRLKLCDLHPTDHDRLVKIFTRDRRAHVVREDGFAVLKASLPVARKRALVLIDPSYEIKEDYERVVEAMQGAWRRMPTACLMLWYPVIHRRKTESMLRALAQSGVRNLWRFELPVKPDGEGRGLTASGMMLINPPWTLPGQMEKLLPVLSRQLAGGWGQTRAECVVPE